MSITLAYHWWSRSPVQVWDDVDSPVLCSISTVRHFNKEIQIVVLDTSDHDNEWGRYPSALDFSVRRTELVVPMVSKDGFRDIGYQLCGKPFLVPKFFKDEGCDVCMFCDSDIFWISDPAALSNDPAFFCCHMYNTGHFYYRRDSEAAARMIQEWQKAVIKMMKIPAYAEEVWRYYPRGTFNDEAAYRSLTQGRPEVCESLCDYLADEHNYTLCECDGGLASVRNVHLMRAIVPQRRGEFAFLVQEFRDIIRSVLPDDLYSLLEKGVPAVTDLHSLSKFISDLRAGWSSSP